MLRGHTHLIEKGIRRLILSQHSGETCSADFHIGFFIRQSQLSEFIYLLVEVRIIHKQGEQFSQKNIQSDPLL